MISVVIPLYNKEKQIAKTLSSVLAQTYSDYEIVVVDDGSKDCSAKVVTSFSDNRIRIIHQSNGGVSAARNRGVAEARGELIAFLDADDEWDSDYLSSQMRLVKEFPECDVFAVNYRIKSEQGVVTATIIRRLPFSGTLGILSNYFEVAANSNPPLWTSAVMVRKSTFEAVGGFPVGVKSGEDLLTWAKLACRFEIAYSTVPLANFNVVGYDYSEKPKREPAVPDIVAKELIALKKAFNPPFLDLYIANWYKMRCAIYMRLDRRKAAIQEAIRGLKFHKSNIKLYLYIVLNLIPFKIKR
jgi:glycosyltransferase involved in cell wall biosynthesis